MGIHSNLKKDLKINYQYGAISIVQFTEVCANNAVYSEKKQSNMSSIFSIVESIVLR